MKILLTALLWGCAAASLGAMGFSEDPQEKLTKSWDLAPVKTLEIRGEIDFELVPGPVAKVTVETTRALFDQLTVSNWWGAATVAIESGLRGPRELGAVKVTVTLPNLTELNVSDRSNGHGVWPGSGGTLRIRDKSTADFMIEGTDFLVETSWLTRVTLRGHLTRLKLDERHQSRMDTTGLATEETSVFLDEESLLEAGPTVKGTGLARHGSRVTVESEEPWQTLVLKEDSVRELRTEKANS